MNNKNCLLQNWIFSNSNTVKVLKLCFLDQLMSALKQVMDSQPCTEIQIILKVVSNWFISSQPEKEEF